MPPDPTGAGGLRERTRRAVAQDIAGVALELFTARGFEQVTVDEIAQAAGISPRSFFRYFATKEDVLLGDTLEAGRRVAAALANRPAHEPAWQALGTALRAIVDEPMHPGQDALAVSRLFLEAPSLRAREVEKQRHWEDLLLPLVQARLDARAPGRGDGPDPRARALVGAALACLRAATEAWVRADGHGDPRDVLDEALHTVHG